MLTSLKRIIKNLNIKLRFFMTTQCSFLLKLYYRYLYSPKKESLEEFLNTLSLTFKDDFFTVQIGANDGITHDPIYKFILRDQWKGVLLEPQPQVFEKFLSKLYSKNDRIEVLCAALGKENGQTEIFKIGFSEMRWATGLASFNKNQLEKAFSSGYVDSQCKKYGLRIPQDQKEKIKSEVIEVISTDSLIRKYAIKKIDLLQIDTEGFDYEVIKMFNIEKTKPRVIIYENSHLSEENQNKCLALLRNNAYQTMQYGPNTLAMRNPEDKFQKYF